MGFLIVQDFGGDDPNPVDLGRQLLVVHGLVDCPYLCQNGVLLLVEGLGGDLLLGLGIGQPISTETSRSPP